MTVLVTGASGSIGPWAVRAFLRSFPEVRAYVRTREAAERLRELGAKVAVGEADDADTLSIAMYGVFTVCHLVGAMDAPDEDGYRIANAGSVETALRAAQEAGVGRFLFLSSPGAEPDASHPYLRAKAEAEAMIAESGLEYAIVRSAHVYGPGPGLWFSTALELALLDPPCVLGAGDASIAPVFVEDVTSVLAAADDRSELVRGTWGLEGPGVVTNEGFARLVNPEAGTVRRFDVGDADEVEELLSRPMSSAAL
ncbi:MAG: NAD(P)H-binding protein, partial [Actinomycetota bacterium]|nr:NAD(P)H-binding protein [Actinomycetota bacterium]